MTASAASCGSWAWFQRVAGVDLSNGNGNSGIGYAILNAVTTGEYNSALGWEALFDVTTGSYNLALGYNAGSQLTTSDSSNIYLSNVGVTGESHVMRLGTSGSGNNQVNKAYIAAVYGTSVSSAVPVVIDSSGQLGTASSFELVWTDKSGNFNADSNNGYFCTAALTATLPAAPAQGDVIQFYCDTGSTVTVTANTGQKIRLAGSISALAGTAACAVQGNALNLVYRSSSATWNAVSSVGSWTIT